MKHPRVALPRVFRRRSLVIVGCGDVGLRLAQQLGPQWRVRALTSSPHRCPDLRAAGVVPLLGNLDQASTLSRLARLSDRVVHLAPPPLQGTKDPRTRHLLQALRQARPSGQIVYGSTTGVYGDCAGSRFDETRAVAPQTDRARRRVDAEQQLRQLGRQGAWRVHILRIPGIYAHDREGGPRERLLRGTPVLRPEDDVYTNHIHADDLARACKAALFFGKPGRVVHVSDDTDLKMGDYFEMAARWLSLPAPRRISRAEALSELSPMTMSFLSESRRLLNHRLKQELRLRLRYPTLTDSPRPL